MSSSLTPIETSMISVVEHLKRELHLRFYRDPLILKRVCFRCGQSDQRYVASLVFFAHTPELSIIEDQNNIMEYFDKIPIILGYISSKSGAILNIR